MSDPEHQKPPRIPPPATAVETSDQVREARLAAALRANLRRRKTGANAAS